jgi:hypothetical protein
MARLASASSFLLIVSDLATVHVCAASFSSSIEILKFTPSTQRRPSTRHRCSAPQGQTTWLPIPHLSNKDLIMNRKLLSAIALAAITLGTGAVYAADDGGPLTREQVRAELAEAIRTGDVVGNGLTGQKLNELYPNRYPKQAIPPSKTREQVRAELAEAVRTGDIVANGVSGQKLKELSPARYPIEQAKAH